MFCVYLNTQAQTKIEIIQTKELVGRESGFEKLQRLIGNVILKHENALMYCDSALFNKANNSLEAFGNVRINEGDSITLTGDYLNYIGDERKAFVKNNVYLSDGDMELYTNQLDYDFKQKTGYYNSGGRIISRNDSLYSQIGLYFAGIKTFHFKRNVRLNSTEYSMTCDTLHYNTQSKTSYFFGATKIVGDDGQIYCENGWYNTGTRQARFSKKAVVSNKDYILKADSIIYGGKFGIDTALRDILLKDTGNKLDIAGEKGIYYRFQQKAMVTGLAQIQQYFETDTLFLHADTLWSITDTLNRNNRIVKAYYNTRFFKQDMQGVCDSLFYSQNDSMIEMYYKPFLWNQNTQINADTIAIYLANGKINRAYFKSNSFVIEQKDSTAFNQINGDMSVSYFVNDAISQTNTKGNVHCLYYMEEDSTTLSGLIDITSDSMRIQFSGNEIDQISFYNQADGNLLPLDTPPPAQSNLLAGFKWNDAIRPKNPIDVFRKINIF